MYTSSVGAGLPRSPEPVPRDTLSPRSLPSSTCDWNSYLNPQGFVSGRVLSVRGSLSSFVPPVRPEPSPVCFRGPSWEGSDLLWPHWGTRRRQNRPKECRGEVQMPQGHSFPSVCVR